MVNLYSTVEKINKFAIGCMINPLIHVKKVFIEQVEKFLKAKFYEKTMEPIRDFMKKKDTCVIVLIMFFENKRTKQKKFYGVKLCSLFSHRQLCLH